MPIDVEEQVAKYFTWIESRVGFPLHADETTRRHEPAWQVDRAEITVGPPPGEPDRRGRFTALALVAAALVACVVVVAARLDRDPSPTISPSPTVVGTVAPTVAPEPTNPPASTAPVTDSTAPSQSTVVVTTAAPDPRDAVIARAEASRACVASPTGGPTAEAVAGLFADAMIDARSIDIAVPVGSCLGQIPDAFTGGVPSCWATCADSTRTFNREAMSVYESFDANNVSTWHARLPVTYRVGDTSVDAIESWVVAPVDNGFEIVEYAIEDPYLERAESIATLDAYLGAIETGDWPEAARLLDSGALSPEERPAIRELEPATFTLDGIADALEAWCTNGCDTTRPTDDEVVFDGGYELTRNGRTIRVGWFEGVYSIDGLPFRVDDTI